MTTELPLEAVPPSRWDQIEYDGYVKRFRAPLSIEQALELSLPDERIQRIFTDYCQKHRAERVYAHILVNLPRLLKGDRFGVVEGLSIAPDAYLSEIPNMFIAVDKERCRGYLQRRREEILESLRRE